MLTLYAVPSPAVLLLVPGACVCLLFLGVLGLFCSIVLFSSVAFALELFKNAVCLHSCGVDFVKITGFNGCFEMAISTYFNVCL